MIPLEKKIEFDKTKLQAFWRLLKETNPPKWIILFAVVLSLAETITGLIVPLLTKLLVDQLAANALEAQVIIFLAIVFLLQAAASGLAFYIMSYIGEGMVRAIRERLWNHVLKLPIPYFDKHQSGEILSRITQDTKTVKDLVTQHLITFISGIISIIGAIIILFWIDWQMTLIMLVSVPLALGIIMPLGRKMYKIALATQDHMAQFSGNLGRVLTDIRLVKAYHAERKEAEKGLNGIQALFRYGLREAKIYAVISPMITFIIMLVLVILIGYGGVRVASGALSSGTLVAIILYMFQIVVPFTQMAAFFTAFQKAIGATERIQTILSKPSEPYDGQQIEVKHNEAITLQHVSFSYATGKQVLHDINLHIPANKTTAIVGPSGSGKTTIFSLIERFYEPTEGTIYFGSTPIHKLDLRKWRQKISYVAQDSPVMTGTIRENICYGMEREVSDAELIQAADFANALEFIEKLPHGFDTYVGERGVTLSGGQKQRIAIARAFIRNPEILLLDEATSHLDSSSEAYVQEALEHLMQKRTTIVIAHRLSTIMNADQIVVLENGKITGTGTHEELYNSHALYKQLADQQSGVDKEVNTVANMNESDI